MVRPGVTGLLAIPQDPSSLGAAISELLAQPGLRAQMRLSCRQTAEREFALKVQAQRYGEIYQELAAAGGGPSKPATGSSQANTAADDGGTL